MTVDCKGKPHLDKPEIAQDILDYCKEHRKRFFTVRSNDGKVRSRTFHRPYTSGELASGLGFARMKKVVERVSNTRWHILTYELPKEET